MDWTPVIVGLVANILGIFFGLSYVKWSSNKSRNQDIREYHNIKD